jgi:hypothetical protein
MYGEGLFDGGFADTAYRRIANEFTNPDSILGSTARAIGNEITNPESDLRRKVENEFTDPNSVLRTNVLSPEVNSAITQLQTTDWGKYKNAIENAFDPEKNGLANDFRRLGGDTTQFFNEVSANLRRVAEENKEGFDRTFAPLLQAFGEDRELSAIIGEQIKGFPQTREDWERVMKDPDTYFDILSVIITIAAVTVTGPSAPAAIAASRAALTAARVITHAAQGKPITNSELLAIGTDIIMPMRAGSFKGLSNVLQPGAIKLRPDALKLGADKAMTIAGDIAKNQFPGAALLITGMVESRGDLLNSLMGNAAGVVPAAAAGEPAQPGEAAPDQPALPAAAAGADAQAEQAAPEVLPPAAAPVVPQVAPGPSGLSRSVARAAAPPQVVNVALQAPVAPSAIRPLPALEVPDPLLYIPISGRQATRLNRRAQSDAAMARERARHEASRRELEQAEEDAGRSAAANERFQRSRGHMEDEYVRFAFGLG